MNLDPQGEIPAVQRERLLQIGNWLKRYGEAIYATRILAPFKTDAVDYTQSKDGKTAYAIVKKPAAEVTLTCAVPDNATVSIIGEGTTLKSARTPDGLKVSLPPAYAEATIPFALKIGR